MIEVRACVRACVQQVLHEVSRNSTNRLNLLANSVSLELAVVCVCVRAAHAQVLGCPAIYTAFQPMYRPVYLFVASSEYHILLLKLEAKDMFSYCKHMCGLDQKFAAILCYQTINFCSLI